MKFECDIPADFLSDLLESDFNEIAKEALEATVPMLEKSVKASCKEVIKDKSRNQLVDSWSPWKGGVKEAGDGLIYGVTPYGKPSKGGKRKHGEGTRNLTLSDIAWWLEMGNSHQSPKPYLDEAGGSVEAQVLQKMEEIYAKKVGAQ